MLNSILKSLIAVSVIIMLSSMLNHAYSNTYLMRNDGIEYTIHYNSMVEYAEIKIAVEIINNLREHYSNQKINRDTLIQYTDNTIYNLKKSGIMITQKCCR